MKGYFIAKNSFVAEVTFKFWNFKTSNFCVRHHFHHYIQYELLIENYCKSLLVYQ